MLRTKKNYITDFLFYSPALILYTFIVTIPFLLGIYYSFTDWDGLRQTINTIGLANYCAVFQDPRFWNAVVNTIFFAFEFTIVVNIIGLVLASFFYHKIRINSILKTAFFFPTLLSTMVVGFIWSYMYSPRYGVINTVLSFFGMGELAQNWLGNPSIALHAIVVSYIWLGIGFSMIVYTSGLQNIPSELYESATIDGAGGVRRFFAITIPLIAPVTTVLFIFNMIVSLKAFDIVFVMTGGGPGFATETIGVLIYEMAFSDSRMSYSTTIGVVLFFGILLITIIQLTLLKRRETEL